MFALQGNRGAFGAPAVLEASFDRNAAFTMAASSDVNLPRTSCKLAGRLEFGGPFFALSRRLLKNSSKLDGTSFPEEAETSRRHFDM
jgi:hypothetical protein